MSDFASLIDRVVEPLHAGARRKRQMHAELLAHLQAAYEQELKRISHPTLATHEAQRRLGDVDQLRCQLQTSVPWIEHVLCKWLCKEILMSGWTWTVVWIVVMACMFIFAGELRPGVTVVGLVGAIGVARLSRPDDPIMRWLGPRWGWRIAGVLIGAAIIMPALAKLKHSLRESLLTTDITKSLAVALTLGTMIVVIGIVSAIHSFTHRHSAAA